MLRMQRELNTSPLKKLAKAFTHALHEFSTVKK